MKVGIVGWRGMVGSVLMQRMQEEDDFSLGFEPVFFTTSQAGQPAPLNAGVLKDASDIAELKQLDVIITCQGGITPRRFTPSCVNRGGTATGSMPPAPCAWKIMRSLFSIR